MKNMNRIYGVGESRSTPLRLAIALGLTVLGAGIMVAAFVVLFVGQLYGPDIAAEIGLQDTAASLFSIGRWPMALVLILFAVALLYWLAPNADLPLKWLTPGALFFALTWVIASFGFGIYVSNFGSYNQTYGALGGVIVLLIWFYLTSFLLLLGVEINGVLAETAGDEPEQSGERAPAPESTSMPRTLGVAMAGLVWVLALIGFMRRRSA